MCVEALSLRENELKNNLVCNQLKVTILRICNMEGYKKLIIQRETGLFLAIGRSGLSQLICCTRIQFIVVGLNMYRFRHLSTVGFRNFPHSDCLNR